MASVSEIGRLIALRVLLPAEWAPWEDSLASMDEHGGCVVTGVELLLGALAGWALRKARRLGGRVDEQVDDALDLGVDRLGELVAGKLGGDPALERLQLEAVAGAVSARTRERVQLSVQDASETDPAFAARLAEALKHLQVIAAAASGPGGSIVLGGVTIRADGGSVAAWSITGPVTIGSGPPESSRSALGPPNPSLPDRA